MANFFLCLRGARVLIKSNATDFGLNRISTRLIFSIKNSRTRNVFRWVSSRSQCGVLEW